MSKLPTPAVLAAAAATAVATVAIAALDPGAVDVARHGHTTTLTAAAPPGTLVRFDASDDLESWTPLATVETPASGTATFTVDTVDDAHQFRAAEVTAPGTVPGEHFPTDDGPLTVHIIDHASYVITWNGYTIYNDPVGPASRYRDFPVADLVMVSHTHGDHLDTDLLEEITVLNFEKRSKIALTNAAFGSLTNPLKSRAILMVIGATGVQVPSTPLHLRAVHAYNANHPQGQGCGFVLTAGGLQIYTAGDTGPVQEMRDLEDIDVAFVPMNLPWTMSVEDAASAVLDFAPKTVIPYHYRNQGGSLADLNRFADLVTAGRATEVRVRDWY